MSRIAIVGGRGGTNVGQSLWNAALKLPLVTDFFDHNDSMRGPRFARRIAWKFMGARPLYLRSFSQSVLDGVEKCRPDVVITTGITPLTASSLIAMKKTGTRIVNYSTDDPWNTRPSWHLRALPQFDVVFTPRRANIEDLKRLGCRDVRYLPFGYDDELFFRDASEKTQNCPSDILFVGGADNDRVEFVSSFIHSGLRPVLVGSYWNRHSKTIPLTVGQKPAEVVRTLTRDAAVNLCLVRRANRDGHTMRSVEIPATGGFMITEDTVEHRAMFGPDGHCTLYFSSPKEAASKCRWAIENPEERRRMAANAHSIIINGNYTYRDRLTSLLDLRTSLVE